MSGVTTGYTSLQTSISDYLARSDLTSWIPLFVQNWEERFYRDPLNVGIWMESALNVATSNNLAALPTDYLRLKNAYLSGILAPPLIRVSLEQLYARYPRAGTLGQPQYISRDGQNFVFGPVPSGSYTIVGTYYAKPTLLRSFASDAAAHWLIVNAPDLLLYGALLEAEPFLKNDARVVLWKSAYDMALDTYRRMQQEEDQSGSAIFSVAM
jgi:hypothetical protein